MTQIPSDLNNLPWSRRGFLKTGLSAGGMVLAAPSIIKAQTPSDTLNVALIGVGSQGRVLLDSLLNIEGLNFQAVCDIWDLSRRYGVNRLKKAGFDPTGYEDIEDLLAKETGLDAVIIATPDFWHAPHTNMCLKAGINVYCEKMMAHTVEAARSMVVAQRESGKLLQYHQQGSDPRSDHQHQRPVEPRGFRRFGIPQTLRDSRRNPEALWFQGHAPVPQLALVP